MEEYKINNYVDSNFDKFESLDLLAEMSIVADLVDKIRDKFYKNFNITRIQVKALYCLYLADGEGFTLSELSEKLNITRPSVTALVDRMASAGLVERFSNKEDRRSIKAIITNRGKEIMDNVIPNDKIFRLSVLDFLTEEEKQLLNKLIMKIERELTNKITNE